MITRIISSNVALFALLLLLPFSLSRAEAPLPSDAQIARMGAGKFLGWYARNRAMSRPIMSDADRDEATSLYAKARRRENVKLLRRLSPSDRANLERAYAQFTRFHRHGSSAASIRLMMTTHEYEWNRPGVEDMFTRCILHYRERVRSDSSPARMKRAVAVGRRMAPKDALEDPESYRDYLAEKRKSLKALEELTRTLRTLPTYPRNQIAIQVREIQDRSRETF